MAAALRARPGERLRLCFLSYRHLTHLARTVLDEYAQRAEIEVVDRAFEGALAVAQERERMGTVDAFVSAGANASYLRGSLKSPVATINVGGYDILLALLRAREHSDRVGIVTHRRTIPEIDAIKELLRIEVTQGAYQTAEEASARVKEMAAQGFPVIIGSSVVMEAAEKLGIHGILAYSLAGVRQGLEDALELARIARLESARYEQLNGVLQHVQEAVLAVDLDDRITAANPAMETLLGLSAGAAIGRFAVEVEPELSLAGVLAGGEAEKGIVLRIRRRDFIANRIPIREHGQISGAMITVYDARTISEADKSLRSQARRRSVLSTRYALSDIRGTSPAIERARGTAARFAATDLTVLLSGESGTGKEVFAQAIHNLSARAGRAFVAVNCSAFPESLLESELFGYEDGAFTGSRKGGKVGLFEAAHTGTLFLDEIGDMPLTLQTRLLRVLQEREIVRLGSVAPIPVDLRIIAATHQPLEELVRQRAFRADLYYRLNTLNLRLPALRERPEDVTVLAEGFVTACLLRMGSRLPAPAVVAPLERWLTAYDWPGNVRELENLCERLTMLVVHFGSADAIPPDILRHDCPELFRHGPAPDVAPEDERAYVAGVLAACDGSRQAAARRLGMSRATLWRRMKQLGIGG
ncbi:propionate catabolism operon regulatory protein PrpR [Azorhizobium oxalatiphilum]|uniref:Propionate catabolism operon regulatory protein PrpR n=1 Tax=Azorhizobium oxalatiphilum TaxID=980631 RepID=A0A917BYM8_9HYPH|nr:propionate catabolism operon regulatory protein PrpR [Azorhizobium oxalatiphilum]GGF61326.1 propionate catabolism operon regulatory protein PrpR [Azorhizobium oxalatiphilum]